MSGAPMSRDPTEISRRGVMLVLSSPSGAGKTSISRELRRREPRLSMSVSVTTRKMRPGEIDGTDYHFIDEARFNAMASRGELLEWAEVHGNLYGTGRDTIERARGAYRGVVFDIDYQGARQIRARLGEGRAIGIFVLPPSMGELERRLRGRGTDEESVVARRMAKAREEISHYPVFDYLIVNDVLDRAYDELRAVVLADRARRARRAFFAEELIAPPVPRE